MNGDDDHFVYEAYDALGIDEEQAVMNEQKASEVELCLGCLQPLAWLPGIFGDPEFYHKVRGGTKRCPGKPPELRPCFGCGRTPSDWNGVEWQLEKSSPHGAVHMFKDWEITPCPGKPPAVEPFPTVCPHVGVDPKDCEICNLREPLSDAEILDFWPRLATIDDSSFQHVARSVWDQIGATIRALQGENEKLQGLRAICLGEYIGELDGKPVPGTIHDGTDAACPGWWRGCDHGVEKMEGCAEKAEQERGELKKEYSIANKALADRILEVARERDEAQKGKQFWENRYKEILAFLLKAQDQLTALREATKEALAYFDQRADIHSENPHAPNEEMRLWEELNQALSQPNPTEKKECTCPWGHSVLCEVHGEPKPTEDKALVDAGLPKHSVEFLLENMRRAGAKRVYLEQQGADEIMGKIYTLRARIEDLEGLAGKLLTAATNHLMGTNEGQRFLKQAKAALAAGNDKVLEEFTTLTEHTASCRKGIVYACNCGFDVVEELRAAGEEE